MPTGYTAKLIKEGQTFPEFAMTCARAFGACVEMRDDPLDKPIPTKFKPSQFYRKRLAKAKREYERLSTISQAEQLEYGKRQKAQELGRLEEWLRRDAAENAKLEAARGQVLRWSPPSSNHGPLKQFMLEQIQTSMNDLEYIRREIRAADCRMPMTYFHTALDSTRRDIRDSEESQRKEEERCSDRTQWVSQLRESLKGL